MKLNKLVVNASPIISLANIGQADLLFQLTHQLIIPFGVYEEITFHKYSDKASIWIEHLERSFIQEVDVPQLIADWNLGKGESQVLALSLHNAKAAVILDDKAAKKCAEVFDIKVMGTISVIIKAKQLGLIPEVKPLLYNLKSNGFRVSDKIITTALNIVSEV